MHTTCFEESTATKEISKGKQGIVVVVKREGRQVYIRRAQCANGKRGIWCLNFLFKPRELINAETIIIVINSPDF